MCPTLSASPSPGPFYLLFSRAFFMCPRGEASRGLQCWKHAHAISEVILSMSMYSGTGQALPRGEQGRNPAPLGQAWQPAGTSGVLAVVKAAVALPSDIVPGQEPVTSPHGPAAQQPMEGHWETQGLYPQGEPSTLRRGGLLSGHKCHNHLTF